MNEPARKRPARAGTGPALLWLALTCASCRPAGPPTIRVSDEAGLRAALRSGVRIQLASGVFPLRAEIHIPRGVHDVEITGAGTVVRAADGFSGTALFRAEEARRIRLVHLALEGNRAALEQRAGLPPSDVPFIRYTRGNGIVFERCEEVSVSSVRLREIAGFAVLAAASRGVRIERLTVEDSGSRNPEGRNNTTGGVLLEEGTRDFEVTASHFRRILGNAVWTHSRYTSPRNANGLIWGNRFQMVGRDAIQVGHATRVRVEGNVIREVGFPPAAVDVENLAIPVGIDTAGNVDHSAYTGNRIEEYNGKCIDLDGFHHGEVRRNTCVNRQDVGAYPHGGFAIVMNNSNPDMESEEVIIERNDIDGVRYGGIFVIGERNLVADNRLQNLNLARCGSAAERADCRWAAGQPDLPRAGIYLGHGAERPAPARRNRIERNRVGGFGMDRHCVVAAPGVDAAANRIAGNRCHDGAR